MTIKHRTKGFVFKKSDRSEADRTFSILTEDYGRLEVVGRAIRKINSKLRYGIDRFYFSEIEFIQGKNNKTLTDAFAIKKFKSSENDLNGDKIACKISEILDKVIRGQEKDKELFNLLYEVFEKLGHKDELLGKEKLIYYYFLWNFLSILGYCPQVQKCISCSVKPEPVNLYFSNKDGGIICRKCLNNHNDAKQISADFIKIIRLILSKDWQILTKVKMDKILKKDIEAISEKYFCYVLPNK